MTLCAIVGINLMRISQGWKNYTLFILLTNILVYAVLMVILYSFYLKGSYDSLVLISSIILPVQGLIHWVITQSYLNVSFETKQIINKDVLFNNPEKLAAVYRFKTCMKVANILVPLLFIALSVCYFIGVTSQNVILYDIGNYGWLAMVTNFTLTWGWSLYKLYRDTTDSDELLPDKRIFILHGSLLTLFLVLQALNIYALWVVLNSKYHSKAYNDWGGINNLSAFLINLAEALTFGLVINLMLPWRQEHKMAREEFQKFLFVGFLNRSKLEAAIHAQYPDLTASQKIFIRSDLDELDLLMTKTSKDITAGMVMVSYEDHEQQAFTAWMEIRMQRDQVWDIVPTNPFMKTYESEPSIIDSIAVDEELYVPNRNEILEESIKSIQGFEDF